MTRTATGQQSATASPADTRPAQCPSAQADMAGSVVIGVVDREAGVPRLAYLSHPQPVTAELLALTGPVAPGEVLRFAAPCAEQACCHFDGVNCRLAQRVVDQLPAVVGSLPVCRIRPDCRWWRQEGRAACFRCPQVITLVPHPSEQQRSVALAEAAEQH